jgi:hypothetical protein
MAINYIHQQGETMSYKNFQIVFKPELNVYAIIDSKFNQEIMCKSIQACKVRISKLIVSRQSFATL